MNSKFEYYIEYNVKDVNKPNVKGAFIDKNQALAGRINSVLVQYHKKIGELYQPPYTVRCSKIICDRLMEMRGVYIEDGTNWMPGGNAKLVIDENIPEDLINVADWGIIKIVDYDFYINGKWDHIV